MPTTPESRLPNPRGDKRGGNRPSAEQPPRIRPLWFVLFMLTALLIVQGLFTASRAPEVSYSEFKTMVRAGRVAAVVVTPTQLQGTMAADASQEPEAFTVARVDDPTLIEELEANDVQISGDVDSEFLPGLLVWVFPLLILIGFSALLFRQMGRAQGGVMAFSRSRARIYAEDDVKVTFADVAGVDEAEEELREVVDFLANPTKYTRLGGHIPKGVLLVGPPGTGKTLLARAVAGEAHVPFFSLSGSEFVEMFVGVGAARVRDLFAQAERRAPSIVFIDELDALGKQRVVSPAGSNEEREQTLNQLLAEMDGFDSRKGVIILSATNRPEVLDPALLRPGRFDRQVLVDKPDVRGREAILGLHTKGVRVDADVDLHVIAVRAAGFAGADLANLVNEAALLAARRNKDAAGMSEFEEAFDRLVAGLEKKRVMSQSERGVIAHHEAGHAIMASVLPGSDPVHKISIVQRGFGALGYTLQLPLEERYLMTRTELRNRLAVLLGGRAAEEIVLGEISTGAQNDLVRATDIARSMVAELGMGETLGVMSIDHRSTGQFLNGEGPGRAASQPVSERTSELIDTEVKQILEDAHEHARRTLTERKELLERLASRLLEQEVLEGDELRALLSLAPPAENVKSDSDQDTRPRDPGQPDVRPSPRGVP